MHKYSVSAVQRPRPTTPTSWCAIENYVEGCSASTSTANKSPSESGPKMRVVIPSKDQPQQGYYFFFHCIFSVFSKIKFAFNSIAFSSFTRKTKFFTLLVQKKKVVFFFKIF